MAKISEKDVLVPADVPKKIKAEYIKNFLNATRHTGKLMLFAGDQKIEHLNDDFFGKDVPGDGADPEHLFRIASKATIGIFATQLGIIAKYGSSYPNIRYLVKLNSKSHLVGTTQKDPLSISLVDIEDVIRLKIESGLDIVGVGYTVYVGSEYEADMLAEAGRIATEAHEHGLITVFWMYPRGKAVQNEKDPHIVAGAAGVGLCLGADFVKVNYPKAPHPAQALREAVKAAGRTKLITAGGSSKSAKDFLQETWDQINISGAKGNATGRNVHQKPLAEAIRMCDAISSITLAGKDVNFAIKVFEGKEKFRL
ncbi:MAG TPA: aldolase [Candidatus Nanoarchaeia archaeon]|nr:aldolase [Candidatus Nanoarchaeia archaeon]